MLLLAGSVYQRRDTAVSGRIFPILRLGAPGLVFETWETTNLRSRKRRPPGRPDHHRRVLPGRPVLADNYLPLRTMISEVFLQIIVPACPLRAACQPEATNRGQNCP